MPFFRKLAARSLVDGRQAKILYCRASRAGHCAASEQPLHTGVWCAAVPSLLGSARGTICASTSLLVVLAALLGSALAAQQPTSAPAAPEKPGTAGAVTDQPKTGPNEPAQTGTDQTAILVAADSDQVTVRLLLRGIDAAPMDDDLEAGLLVIDQQPNWLGRPTIRLVPNQDAQQRNGGYSTELKITNLVTFGEGKFSLFYKGRRIEDLRVSKPGLSARPATGDAFVAREEDEFLFVLQNPSTFKYASVRARLRFEGEDACVFAPETFGIGQAVATKTSNPSQVSVCGANSQWTAFDIPQYAQTTVRVNPPHSWFIDPDTGYARGAKRKGWLTLRFGSADSQQIYEQNLPIEIQFQPSVRSLTRDFSKMAACWSLVLFFLSCCVFPS
jgi:hypothetical protein